MWIPSQLELAVALIGTSLPALRQMFSRSSHPPYLQSGQQSGHYAIYSMVYTADKGRSSVINPIVRGGWPYGIVDDIEARALSSR